MARRGPPLRRLLAQLAALEHSELQERQTLAEIDILTMGITFTVYSDGKGIDRAWPFDIIPRIIAAAEWRQVELGLEATAGARSTGSSTTCTTISRSSATACSPPTC